MIVESGDEELFIEDERHPKSFMMKVLNKAKELKLPYGEVPGEVVFDLIINEADKDELQYMMEYCIKKEQYETAAEFKRLMTNKGFIEE